MGRAGKSVPRGVLLAEAGALQREQLQSGPGA